MNRYINPDSQQYFAFNIWNTESAKAVMDAAAQTGRSVILQTSMKAFEQLDKEEFREYVKNYGDRKKIKVYLHLDHCRKISMIQEAVECGWDSVMADGSDRPLEDNIRFTNEAARAARRKDILVEAEVGQICGQGDGLFPVKAGIAEMPDVREFIKETDVDMVAAAVGTVHGLYKGAPQVRYDMIEEIAGITGIPFVVHGGTGLTDQTLLKLFSYKNVKKVNISTGVKLAYRQGIVESIRAGDMEGNGFDPLKVGRAVHDSIRDMAAGKLELLGKGGESENNTCP